MTDDKRKTDVDEVAEEQLEDVSGGATVFANAPAASAEAGAIPDIFQTPDPGGSTIPIPYPNSGGGDTTGAGDKKVTLGGGDSGGT